MRPGQAFENEEVAGCYVHRPPYPDEFYDKLLDISPAHGAALDLGCGPGKIAHRLSRSFDSVCAIDPSEAMLVIAKSLEGHAPSNITWLRGTAESVSFECQPFDLIVAGASIHWMDHAIVFPRLLDVVNTTYAFAVVDGDAPFQPPWESDWHDFVERWLLKLQEEGRYVQRAEAGSYQEFMNRYRRFLDISGETAILSQPVSQRVENFVLCQHSRDTFASFKLGSLREEYDQELESILRPHVTDGRITFRVRTELTWGSIRTNTKS